MANKEAIIYAFLEQNVKPRFEKIIEEVNKYLKTKYNVSVGADLQWIVQDLDKTIEKKQNE